MIDLNNPLFIKMIVGPFALLIVLFVFHIISFIKIKNNSEIVFSKKSDTLHVSQIIVLFPLFFMLTLSGVIYSFIAFGKINGVDILDAISIESINNFTYSIYASMLLKNIAIYFFLKKSFTINKIQLGKYLAFLILAIALCEIPEIGGLIYIFNVIDQL